MLLGDELSCCAYCRCKATASWRRYALNWVKLRAWGLTDWDALLMLDADTSAVGDVRGLFALPTDFAVVLDEDKRARRCALRRPGPCDDDDLQMLSLSAHS